MFRILIERKQHRVAIANAPSQENLTYQMLQPLRLQPGKLDGVHVVKR